MSFWLILNIINGIIWLIAMWINHCNNRTLKQRRAILEMLSGMPIESMYFNLWEQYKAVSYTQHLKYLVLCRNPWKLYKSESNEQEKIAA